MANDIVALRKDGPLATVTLQRSPANAISIELIERIGGVFESVADDPSIRAVILTGQGTSFCAGLDLKIVPLLGAAEQKRLLKCAQSRALRPLWLPPAGRRRHQWPCHCGRTRPGAGLRLAHRG